ncbi:ribosome maturation factor [Sulfurospirillum sp. T05]|uniref:Ribosome maturation factor RimP n=1 Tax=Sulfurospirillum tamanense TaxID=2813362 RepID=A0ABS2WPH2_9BACT|nr:ribosome maturation factor [Sulfurospirillum tamanensis]MBN2963455.1 ribosome maturation factor [Sulfurospirillum tamanensis]
MNETRLKALLQDAGVELYDTETTMDAGRKIFRVYITCKEGVTLEMCSKVTHILSPVLDLEPPVSGQYYLEVSSPGLERKLTKPSHYARSIGEMVKIKTFEKESLEGKLVDVSDTTIRLELPEATQEIAFSEISKARTFVVW